MTSSLQEDFSDVADFVKEDEEQSSEDEIERKIAEEHAKYKEAQARRQEEVRASRPWSAAPVDSPRPEQQKERERERQARSSNPDVVVDAPRSEYEPPARPFLLQAQASGSNLSYLSRPQSAELRAGNRLLNGRTSRASLSGIEEETGEGTAANSRQTSDLGRLGSTRGEHRSSSGIVADDPMGREPYGAIKEEEEEEGEGEEHSDRQTAGLLATAASLIAAAEESSAHPVQAVDEEGGEELRGSGAGDTGGRDQEDEEEGGAGRLGFQGAEPSAQEVDEDDEEQEGAGGGEQVKPDDDDGVRLGSTEGPLGASNGWQQQQQQNSWRRSGSGVDRVSGGGDGYGTAGSRYGKSGPPSVATSAAVTTPRSMAMRGFVEPLAYEASKKEEARPNMDDEEEDDDYEEDYEDSFEEDGDGTEDTGTADLPTVSAEPSARSAVGLVRSKAASSFHAPSKEPSRALSPPPPASYPSTPGGAGAAPPALFADPSAAGPLAADPTAALLSMVASHRSLSSAGGISAVVTGAAAAPPPLPPQVPADSELLPPQQFALQLLKHDIDVLPQHHRAAASAAAAARRKTSASARPAGAGLAAFGYLGYHVMPDDLTAPSGPAFRGASPGRSSSPGRGGAGTVPALGTVSSMKARPGSGEDGGRAADQGEGGSGGMGRGGRPISAPHMRPSGVSTDGGDVTGKDAAAPPPLTFISTTREIRAGRLLPPVAPAPLRAGGRTSSGGSGRPGGMPPTTDGAVSHPTHPGSLSVLDEQELNHVQQGRIKFDVWLDSLTLADNVAGGVGKAPGATGDDHGATAASGRRPPRPMTAPATGRRRPVSARPGAGAAGGNGVYGVPAPGGGVPKPLGRPVSAQPFPHARPASANQGGHAVGGRTSGTVSGLEPGLGLSDVGVPPLSPPELAPAPPAGGTAAVEIGGVTVSVYVADTLKRIVEANRWLQQLGVSTKRYRLKDRLSAMTVQLVEELPPLPSEKGMYHQYDSGAVAVVKELTLKQFLSGHAKLKQQAKKLRNQAAMAVPPLPPGAGQASYGASGGGMYGMTDFSGGGSRAHRPFSANPTHGGGGGGRVRPASAMQHSGIRIPSSSTGGGEPIAYTGPSAAASGPHSGGYPSGRPARPSSANPAYGRTPTFNGGTASSPPGASAGHFTAAYPAGGNGPAGATVVRGPSVGAASPGRGLPHLRAAWGASGSGAQHQNYTITSTGGSNIPAGLPYMYRSVSATARTPSFPLVEYDDDDGEPDLVAEPDEHGDVSRGVRQQLGGAADFCQARRNEIARLRTMPYA